jgi:TRAP-type C4-dicarboxylate transport system permease small subunit
MANARGAAAFDHTFAGLAAAFLFAMMGLTFFDVGARYFFNRPIPGSLEITELLLVGVIFTGLPLVSRKGEHVSIDLLDRFFPATLRAVLHRLTHLLCAAVLLALAWLLYRKAVQLGDYGDQTAVLKVALAPFVYGMSGMTLITAVIHFVEVFRRES